MTLVRRVARPMLASMFVAEGLGALRDPAPRVARAGGARTPISFIPHVPQDPKGQVKVNAGVMVGAGVMFGLGRLPRLSALLLALSTIETTLSAHRFWERETKKEQTEERTQFFKNLGLLGGLMLATVDTEGQPGVAWRMRHAGHHTAVGSRRAARTARREARLAAHAAKAKLPG